MFVAGRSLKKHHENVRVNVFNATGITMFSFKYQSIFNE
jgi:hypothetical protein